MVRAMAATGTWYCSARTNGIAPAGPAATSIAGFDHSGLTGNTMVTNSQVTKGMTASFRPDIAKGQRFNLKNYGMPERMGGRGDLIVSVKIRFPASNTTRKTALWQALSREYGA